MAITHVNTTQAADPNNGSVTVTKPPGTTSGDVLIACLAQNEQSVTLPSGFTLVEQATGGTTTNTFSGHMYRKTAGGSEPADYTFSVGASGAPMAVVLSAWRGVDTTTPIDDSAVVADGGTGEPANPSISITTTTNCRLLFSRIARSTSAIPTFSNGTADWSELGDIGEFSGGTVRYSSSLFAKDFDESAGSKTEPAITCSTTETDNVYILVALVSGNPSDSDSGTGSEAESFADISFGDSDSGTGTETEIVGIPIADSDSGTVSEGENIATQVVSIISDNFNRANETPLNVSSSGHQWTSLSAGSLGVVNNECKKTA